MKAIIGGTGFTMLDGLELVERTIETPYGNTILYVAEEQLVFLPRHGKGHTRPPHMINHRANIDALSQLGVTEVVSIYAVGSITDRLKPGKVGIIGDFVDLGGQAHTFYDQEVVHISIEEPFSISLQNRALALEASLVEELIYVSTVGPRLETKAEIAFYGRQGFDVVGMTLAAEATLLAERKIPTLALAYSINWAAGVKEAFAFISDEEIANLKDEITQLCCSILSI